MKLFRIAVLFSLLAALSACKITQLAPRGGTIVSASGNHDCPLQQPCSIDKHSGKLICPEESICNIEIESGSTFGETFTAIPDPGFRFQRWAPAIQGEKIPLCADSVLPCSVIVPDAFSVFDFSVYLHAIFETDPNFDTADYFTVLPVYGENTRMQQVVPYDLNRDGFNDLIFYGTAYDPFYEGNHIHAYVNNQDGTFSNKTDQYFPLYNGDDWSWVNKVSVADLNNDGHLDLVHYSDGGSVLPPFIASEDGSFTLLNDPAISEEFYTNLLPIDIDNDGDTDLISMNMGYVPELDHVSWNLHTIRVIENISTIEGELVLSAHAGIINGDLIAGIENNIGMHAPLIIDINNDEFPDFLYHGGQYGGTLGTTGNAMPIRIFMNTGNNTFEERADEIFDGAMPSIVHNRVTAAADIDGSGNLSIIMANHGHDTAPWSGEANTILRNVGDGKLTADFGTPDTHNYSGFTHSMSTGDIDHDGDTDIVYIGGGDDTSGRDSIRILENDGNGNFSNTFFLWTGSYSGGQGWDASVLTDLNNDGYPELVLGANGPGTDTLILWNDGKGNFSSAGY